MTCAVEGRETCEKTIPSKKEENSFYAFLVAVSAIAAVTIAAVTTFSWFR
jgi:hypothetical protein